MAAISYRRKLVAILAAVIFAGIFGTALLLPREYTTTSSILIDLNDTDPASNDKHTSSEIVDTIVGTQMDILRSNAVMSEAAQKANIINSQPGNDQNSKLQRAITVLRNSFGVTTEKGSNVIRLYYTANAPDEAAKRLNIIVDTFLTKQVQLRTVAAQTSTKWYDARSAEVEKRYQAAQKRLTDFQRANNIVGFDRMDIAGDKVKTISSALAQAQADMALANSRAGSVNDPEVAKSTIVQDLEREVGMQAAQVADLSKTLGSSHPKMVAATAQLEQLRQSLASARAGQANSLSSASASASRRAAELQALLARQQQDMVKMSAVQDQLTVLQRDVDAAQQSYDTVRQRYNESALRSQVSQANASLLDRADTPAFPSKPSLALWFVAAILFAGFGSIGFVAWQEITRPRVRTAEGTARLIDSEVIIDMTAPLRRKAAILQTAGELT